MGKVMSESGKVLLTTKNGSELLFLNENSYCGGFEFSINNEMPESVCDAIRSGLFQVYSKERFRFKVYSDRFTLFSDDERIVDRHKGCLMGGFADKIHGNEGVRNYLLKLGIKEYESKHKANSIGSVRV